LALRVEIRPVDETVKHVDEGKVTQTRLSYQVSNGSIQEESDSMPRRQ